MTRLETMLEVRSYILDLPDDSRKGEIRISKLEKRITCWRANLSLCGRKKGFQVL